MDALSDGTQPVEEGRERLAAVLARDGAKRAPSGYSEGEMTAIMEALSDGGRYNHTYDGRPVLVRMAPDEIRKLFRKSRRAAGRRADGYGLRAGVNERKNRLSWR